MPDIAATRLTTTTPGGQRLDICDGFAFFPKIGAARIGKTVIPKGGTLFDVGLNLEIFKVRLSAELDLFVGFCGPSYAAEINTDASSSYTPSAVPGQPASGSLVLNQCQLRGGMESGVRLEFDLDLEFDVNLFFWRHQYHTGFQVGFDLIEEIFNLLLEKAAGGGEEKEGSGGEDGDEIELQDFNNTDQQPEEDGDVELQDQNGGGQDPSNTRPKAKGPAVSMDASYLVDSDTEAFSVDSAQSGPPTGSVTPTLEFGFNVVPLFDGVPILDVIAEIDQFAEKLGGGFSFGPGFALGLPVHVTMPKATINNHDFDVTAAAPSPSNKDQTVLTLREEVDPNLPPLGDAADEIGVTLSHTVGFTAGFYLFGDVCFAKVFNFYGQTETFNFIDDENAFGPYANTLRSLPGGGKIPFGPPTARPVVSGYTANQPSGRFKDGVLARYAVSFWTFLSSGGIYESPLSPFTPFDPQSRFYAYGQLTDIPIDGTQQAFGRNIYRQFEGGQVELIGTLNDNFTTTFTDTAP
jgi:hypothetical protein